MKKTMVARECAQALHATEASLEATLVSAKATLERLTAAKTELGLTGTMGDACLARMQDTVATLETALEELYASHREAYTVMKAVDYRSEMSAWVPSTGKAFDRPGLDTAEVA